MQQNKITNSTFCFPVLDSLDRFIENSIMSGYKARLIYTSSKSLQQIIEKKVLGQGNVKKLT